MRSHVKSHIPFLTIWNKNGNSESRGYDGSSDGYKAFLRYWLLHVELQSFAGEEEGIYTHSRR